MLTELQRNTFRLHEFLFSYMYPIPIQWEKDFSQLNLSTSISVWTRWIGSLLLVIAFGLASVVAPIIHNLRSFWQLEQLQPYTLKLDSVSNAVLFTVGLTIMHISIIGFKTITTLKELVSIFNEAIQISIDLTEEYPNKKRSHVWRDELRENLSDRYGVVISLTVIIGSLFPLATTFGGLYTDYDVTFLLLEDFILPDAYNREMRWILVGLAIRGVIIFMLSMESARSATFFICCCLAGVDHSSRIINLLTNRVTNFTEFLYVYTNLRLLYCKVRKWVDSIIYLSLGFCFWSTVGTSWISVQCYGKLPWPVYYGSVFLALFLIFGHAFLLPYTMHSAELSVKVVKVHCQRARLTYAQRKSRHLIIQLKQGEATAPIRFWYGPFWVIGNEFAGHYLSLLLLRTFDAILILKI